jgi:hypothetical protein
VLQTRITPPTDAATFSEQWLRVDGLPIGTVIGGWAKGEYVDDTDANYGWRIVLSPDDTAVTPAGDTGNLRAAGPGTFSVSAVGSAFYAYASIEYNAANAQEGVPLDISWLPTVVGTHGLTLTAVDEPTIPGHLSGRYGLALSDILTYVVENGAPELDVFSVEDAEFVVPHVLHTGTVRELIESMSVFGVTNGRVPDWGVYENGFFWGEPGSFGRTWRINRNQMAVASDEGISGDDMCQGVVITYTDGAGMVRSVGPPGTDADVGSLLLNDSSPNNPAPPNRIKVRDAGLTTLEGAILVGQALLAETNNPPHKGTVTITGDLEDDAGNVGHASEVRACDRVVIVNDEDPTEQSIVSTTYEHDSLTVTANVGLAPANIETLLARLAASVSGL